MEKSRENFPVTDEQPDNVNTTKEHKDAQEQPTPDNNLWDKDKPSIFVSGGLDIDDINKRWRKCLKKHRALPDNEQTAVKMAKFISKKFTKKEVVAMFINESNDANDGPEEALFEALLGAMTGKTKVSAHVIHVPRTKTDA